MQPVTEGRCPTEYNGTGIRFQDPKTNKWFYATFEVIPSSFEEFQEEDTEEIICGQRVVNSRDRLHLLEGKIKFSRTIFITCQKRTFLRGPHVNFFFGLQLFSHFFGAQPPIKGEEIDFSGGIHAIFLTRVKRVTGTHAVYPRLDERLHFDRYYTMILDKRLRSEG